MSSLIKVFIQVYIILLEGIDMEQVSCFKLFILRSKNYCGGSQTRFFRDVSQRAVYCLPPAFAISCFFNTLGCEKIEVLEYIH